MSIIQVNHIQSSCRTRFATLIDLSDVKTTDPDERDNQFLTRALAAFTIAAVAKVDDIQSAKSVVDEFHDDGIDAFFFDRTEHVAYLVQSKWIKNGSNSMDLGSVLKFIQGVNHLLEGKITELGSKMQAKNQDIQDVLADSQATFVLIVAYTGKPALSIEVKAPLEQLLQDLNDDGDFVSLQVFKQKELHDIVEQRALGASVDLTVLLHEWGKVQEPYKAYYGQVDVTDIVSWGVFGDHLYHKNIRGFKGSNEVNDAIAATIKDFPDNFLYFNNGITLLCSEVNKQPLGGKSRTSGVFDCKGASVVNGAQTVGSIISALSVPQATSTARVMVRLISLEGCPPEFGSVVTRATNTQNRIEKRDFAALDKEQSRLKSDLLLSLGKDYVFRTGDLPPSPDKGCTLDEATVALACANPDFTYCMTAKREVSKLYEDIENAPYTVIFNSGLTAVKLWRAVEVLRAVDSFVKDTITTKEGKERLVAIHGNRVLLHLVFQALGDDIFDSNNADTEIAKIPKIADKALTDLWAQFLLNYDSSYPAQLFKNIKKCKLLVTEISS